MLRKLSGEGVEESLEIDKGKVPIPRIVRKVELCMTTLEFDSNTGSFCLDYF
jgi:hypothetical protein